MSFRVRGKTGMISIRMLRWLVVLCLLAACPFLYKDLMETRSRNATSQAFHALTDLGMAIHTYYCTKNRLPGPTFAEVTTALRGPDYEKYYAKYFTGYLGQQALNGYGVWGHRLYYEVRSPTEVIVRSFGANGIDDRGGGDDITVRVTPLGGAQVLEGRQGD